jgi:bacillithiol biosynthesis cysteine-adding enzyme BshC
MGLDFFASFIRGERAAVELLSSRPFDPGAWDDAARRAGARRVPGDLLAELRRQSASLPPSPSRDRQLDALGREGTTVVVTGQQVGLFLGPLYTLHKAATVVARARAISERTGRPCVPLFWLQTEDHDWAEVAGAEILVPSGRHVLALPPETPGEARVSLSHRVLPSEVSGLVESLAQLLSDLPFASEVSALVARHYRPGTSPGAAFAGVLSELFADDGLVVLDPRTPAVARLASPLLRRAIVEHDAIAGLLETRGRELASRGFAEQVHVRREASLAFFHPRGPGGPRYRLVRRQDGFETPEGRVPEGELLARLEADPLWFSTSALLRPLVQDTLLPTVAYVGGPAECTYFAQLPPVYAHLGVALPLIAPRARLRILVPKARRKLEQLGLSPADADAPREVLLARLVTRPEGLPPSVVLREELVGALERRLAELEPGLLAVDPSLGRNVRKTRRHASFAAGKLLAAVERALARKDAVTTGRLDRLLDALRPSGKPQERVYAFPALAARLEPGALIRAVVEAAGPLSADVRDVSP